MIVFNYFFQLWFFDLDVALSQGLDNIVDIDRDPVAIFILANLADVAHDLSLSIVAVFFSASLVLFRL